MATTKQDISNWFDRGLDLGADFMIIVCDTFDYEDYPVFCTSDVFKETHDKHNGQDMQKIMEVYDLSMDKDEQLSQERVFNYPRA